MPYGFDFRKINENALQGTGRRIEDALKGITQEIEKTAESAGALKTYFYLIMDAQLNIKDEAFYSVDFQENIDDTRTPYGTVHGSDWGWKNTFSLEFGRACVF